MDSRLRSLARRQADVVAAWQLVAAGWTWRRIEHHARRHGWRAVHPGVYVLSSAPVNRPATPRRRARVPVQEARWRRDPPHRDPDHDRGADIGRPGARPRREAAGPRLARGDPAEAHHGAAGARRARSSSRPPRHAAAPGARDALFSAPVLAHPLGRRGAGPGTAPRCRRRASARQRHGGGRRRTRARSVPGARPGTRCGGCRAARCTARQPDSWTTGAGNGIISALWRHRRRRPYLARSSGPTTRQSPRRS